MLALILLLPKRVCAIAGMAKITSARSALMDQIKNSGSLTAGNFGVGSKPMSGTPTLETIKTTVADKLNAGAGIIRQQVEQTQNNALAGFADQASGWLDTAADYVRQVDPQKVKADLQKQIRRNPGRSLIVAGAAGLLLGIMLRR